MWPKAHHVKCCDVKWKETFYWYFDFILRPWSWIMMYVPVVSGERPKILEKLILFSIIVFNMIILLAVLQVKAGKTLIEALYRCITWSHFHWSHIGWANLYHFIMLNNNYGDEPITFIKSSRFLHKMSFHTSNCNIRK